MTMQTTDIYCPECGDPAEECRRRTGASRARCRTAGTWGDRTALCPVMTSDGYRPAEPIERADLDDTEAMNEAGA